MVLLGPYVFINSFLFSQTNINIGNMEDMKTEIISNNENLSKIIQFVFLIAQKQCCKSMVCTEQS